MGLFDAFKRKPLHPSGSAGTAASVAPSTQQQPPQSVKSVKLNEDFEAEVEACGLKKD